MKQCVDVGVIFFPVIVVLRPFNPLMHKVAKMVTENNRVRRHTGLTYVLLILRSGAQIARIVRQNVHVSPSIAAMRRGGGDHGGRALATGKQAAELLPPP